jgi:hypothetical protein
MEAVGEKPEGLRLLVERYSASPSANIAVYLALVFGKKLMSESWAVLPIWFSQEAITNDQRVRAREGALRYH